MGNGETERVLTTQHFERRIYLPVIVGSVDRVAHDVRRLLVRVREPLADREYQVACYLTDWNIVEVQDETVKEVRYVRHTRL